MASSPSLLALQLLAIVGVLSLLPRASLAVIAPKHLPLWASQKAPGPAAQLFTSMSRQAGSGFRVYHNVFWHNHRFYAILPPERMDDRAYLDDGLSVGQLLVRLPVQDLQAYMDVTRMSFVRGTTLLVDYPFQQLTNHLSHWAETMVPTYSVLRRGLWRTLIKQGEGAAAEQQPKLDQVLFPNMNQDLIPWFKATLSVRATRLRALASSGAAGRARGGRGGMPAPHRAGRGRPPRGGGGSKASRSGLWGHSG